MSPLENVNRFGKFSWSKNDCIYLDTKLKFFKIVEKKRFSTSTKSFNGRVRFQPIHAIAESSGECSTNLASKAKFSPTQIPRISENMDEQLKLAHRVADAADSPNRKICVTMVRYNKEKLESSYAQARLFAKKRRKRSFYKLFR